MKRIINRVVYSTDKAVLIATLEGCRGEALYRGKCGRWFAVDSLADAIFPLSRDGAYQMLESAGRYDAIEAHLADMLTEA